MELEEMAVLMLLAAEVVVEEAGKQAQEHPGLQVKEMPEVRLGQVAVVAVAVAQEQLEVQVLMLAVAEALVRLTL
jgi:hypothetical protein